MSHDDQTADGLPKRVVGANMPTPPPPPEGGWFGIEVPWPTEDLDERTRQAVNVLHECELPEDSELGQLLQRLLDGLHNLDPPKPIDDANAIDTLHPDARNELPEATGRN